MSKIAKVSGWKARPYVQAKQPFTNHNKQLYAVQHTPTLYVVYSYGDHWPLFVHDGFDWYENEDKFSRTTTRHRSNAHPFTPTQLRSCGWLKGFIRDHIGYHRQMERFQQDMGLAA